MSVEEIKALERRWFDKWNKGKAAAIAVIDELYATDFICHPRTGKYVRSLKEIKKNTGEVYSAFPDAHFNIDDMVVEGDKAVTRFTCASTHKGGPHGYPPYQ